MARPVRKDQVPQQLERARGLVEEDDLEGALALVDACLAARPEGDDAVDAHFLRAEVLLDLGRYRDALGSYEAALGGAPGDPDILAGRGDALFNLWRFDDAQKDYERALREDPDLARAHRGLALCHDRGERRKLSEKHFARAAKLDAEAYPVPARIPRADFDACARAAIEALPAQIVSRLGPIGFLVEDYPALPMLADRPDDADPQTLGVFFGEEIPARFEGRATAFVPNHIHLFQRNLEQFVASRDELLDEIRTTVWHEIGHYLGYDEDGLDALGLG